MCQTKSTREEGAPPLESVGCHLKGAPPLQEGRTSLIPCANISQDINQSNANHMDLVPFDSLIDFAFILSSILSPFIFFIFDLADFY
jgi:hypothetical protein